MITLSSQMKRFRCTVQSWSDRKCLSSFSNDLTIRGALESHHKDPKTMDDETSGNEHTNESIIFKYFPLLTEKWAGISYSLSMSKSKHQLCYSQRVFMFHMFSELGSISITNLFPLLNWISDCFNYLCNEGIHSEPAKKLSQICVHPLTWWWPTWLFWLPRFLFYKIPQRLSDISRFWYQVTHIFD